MLIHLVDVEEEEINGVKCKLFQLVMPDPTDSFPTVLRYVFVLYRVLTFTHSYMYEGCVVPC